METKQRIKIVVLSVLLVGVCLGNTPMLPPQAVQAQEEQIDPRGGFYSEEIVQLGNGTEVSIVTLGCAPGMPNTFESAEPLHVDDLPLTARLIPNFPSYNWVFGCSAVSASMIAGYYDNAGYPNMYTGPTNRGIIPLTDTQWPKWMDSTNHEYVNNPLVASHRGLDGRTSKGTIDDYWVSYLSASDDPYITGGWLEHTYETVGDYMYTSQSKHRLRDGATRFITWVGTPEPYTCADMDEYDDKDGTRGLRNFYQSRGYTVTKCYNQKIDSQIAGGFSLAQFKAEINAGRPVLIHLQGHTIAGFGYDGSTIYFRNTWNSDPTVLFSMPWGGSWGQMPMISVSIVQLTPPPPLAPKSFIPLIFSPQIPSNKQ